MTMTITRLDADRAVLRTDDGCELIVPRSELPVSAKEGDVVTARFDGSESAKDVLNEILSDGT